MTREAVAIVAILKDEEAFVDEWIAYHRLLGVEHFYLYDDDPALPLAAQVRAYADFVTVIPWGAGDHAALRGRNRQTKAYESALARVREPWVAFLDCDELVALPRHDDLPAFVGSLDGASAVRLHWHLFGHNGCYGNPRFVTSELTRRRREPNRMTKAITRVAAIREIDSAHFCKLAAGERTVDANGRRFEDELYPGKTDAAHVNHYMCRSFTSWMGRARRGEVAFDAPNDDREHRWRFSENGLLRKFVEITRDCNELVDEELARFQPRIAAFLEARH